MVYVQNEINMNSIEYRLKHKCINMSRKWKHEIASKEGKWSQKSCQHPLYKMNWES